jgi:hypothetical protein
VEALGSKVASWLNKRWEGQKAHAGSKKVERVTRVPIGAAKNGEAFNEVKVKDFTQVQEDKQRTLKNHGWVVVRWYLPNSVTPMGAVDLGEIGCLEDALVVGGGFVQGQDVIQ